MAGIQAAVTTRVLLQHASSLLLGSGRPAAAEAHAQVLVHARGRCVDTSRGPVALAGPGAGRVIEGPPRGAGRRRLARHDAGGKARVRAGAVGGAPADGAGGAAGRAGAVADQTPKPVAHGTRRTPAQRAGVFGYEVLNFNRLEQQTPRVAYGGPAAKSTGQARTNARTRPALPAADTV
uniref:Uncharacterized protein n=1 Tax=Setaria viridis TaxID=4556 RepID=A0A4U6VFC3_SETVI|nr:hypothetical protein SEVIR_3G322206v2 [Setaria viridis]